MVCRGNKGNSFFNKVKEFLICYTKSSNLGSEVLRSCPQSLYDSKGEKNNCKYPLSFVIWLTVVIKLIKIKLF